MIPKIEVTGLGDYTRNVGCKTGSITYEFETKTFNYDRGIRLLADVVDVEEAGVLDCSVEAGSELQRVQVAPEATSCASAAWRTSPAPAPTGWPGSRTGCARSSPSPGPGAASPAWCATP